MTGQSDVKQEILVDGWPDGYIDERAWVAVSDEIDTPEKAVALLEQEFPPEDIDDTAEYMSAGKCWMAPDGEPQSDGSLLQRNARTGAVERYHPPEIPWAPTDSPSDYGAKEFWVIEVVDTEELDGINDAPRHDPDAVSRSAFEQAHADFIPVRADDDDDED